MTSANARTGQQPDSSLVWNAAWAALLLAGLAAWATGNWILPALHIAPSSGLHFFAAPSTNRRPEPLEQQRYLLAIFAALAVVPVALLLARRPSLVRATRPAPAIGCTALAVLITLSLSRDHALVGRFFPLLSPLEAIWIAIVAASVANLALGPARGAFRWIGLRLQSRPGEAAALACAVLIAIAVSLAGVYSDGTATLGPQVTWGHFPYTFEEAYAVTLGRTPLVDYTPQYSALVSWLSAPLLMLHTPSVAMFTTLMAAMTTFSLTCLYVTFRMVTGGAGSALVLYLPVCALGSLPTNLFPGGHVQSAVSYFAAMPLRYGGPLVLLAVCVWATGDPSSRRRVVATGAAAGGAILMNFEFGTVAAAGAVLAMLVANRDGSTGVHGATFRQGRDLALGATTVFVVFALLTLVRSGSLPHPSQLIYFNRQFAAAGFMMLPIDHLLGIHALVFVTCAGAAVTGLLLALSGAVRPGAAGRRSVVLLIFSGVFGFGALAYFVGRSHPDVLPATFFGWAIALAALCWEAVNHLGNAGRFRRAPHAPAALAVTAAGIVVGVGALGQFGYVFDQPGRLLSKDRGTASLTEPSAVNIARQCLPRGSNTLIFTELPDRVAHEAGVKNWLPFDHPGAITTHEQLNEVFAAAKRRHVTTALTQDAPPEIGPALVSNGFVATLTVITPPPAHPMPFGDPPPVTIVWALSSEPHATPCHSA